MSTGSVVRNMMRAIRVTAYGGAEQCRLATDVPIPSPGPNQVLVKVRAVGVNPVDTYIVTGTHTIKPPLPFTPGGDAAGTVASVGEGVSRLKEGERVWCYRSVTGAYAEYAVVDQHNTFPLPDSLSFNEGASVGTPYMTAVVALLQRAAAQPGETVFIHGASGAVGLACTQLAAGQGLVVVGSAGTAAGLALVREQGADAAFNHRQDGYMDQVKAACNGGVGPDIIIEMLANVNLEADCSIAAPGARIMVVGSRGSIPFTPRLTMVKMIDVRGVMLPSASKASLASGAALVTSGLRGGWLKPVVADTYPLSQAGQAQRDVIAHTGGSRGKLVLDLDLED